MSGCEACEMGDTRTSGGCHATPYLHAFRYGTEPWFHGVDALTPLDRCVDCGTPVGGHHHLSCLYAKCSICLDQAVCCEHNPEVPR